MKVNELRKQISEMDSAELEQKLAEYKAELFNLRFQMAMGQLENPMRIREVRKAVARVKTRMRQRELNIG
ncbi:MAG: 50S ribosomal protein L29 [Firmicutes bacterium]|jgi:large subunit ribosomal protein L29|nr:50S ribosomal protein L29 [Bacillota bacterium]